MSAPAPALPGGSPPRRRAVIELGTNSVKLLVGDVAGEQVAPVFEASRQTRLGRGFYPHLQLQPGPVAETAAAAAAFQQQAREHGAEVVRALATSAAREATNADDLRQAVRTVTGLELEILTGEQEARWGFEGVSTDPRLADQPILLVDAGGGSTEFTLGRRRDLRFHQSLRLGAVRLLEELAPADPPQPADLLRAQRRVRDQLEAELAPALRPRLVACGAAGVRLIGTGGTATILALMAQGLTRFERGRVDGFSLSRGQVAEWLQRLWTLPLARRRQLPGLPPERADVILTGVLIYEAVMAAFGLSQLQVTTRSLRYAALVHWPTASGA